MFRLSLSTVCSLSATFVLPTLLEAGEEGLSEVTDLRFCSFDTFFLSSGGCLLSAGSSFSSSCAEWSLLEGEGEDWSSLAFVWPRLVRAALFFFSCRAYASRSR